MLVQSFVSLSGYVLMNIGVRYNKFDGLQSFLLDTFDVDISGARNPKGVLGQVRIKVPK